jgi:hypothetical protein
VTQAFLLELSIQPGGARKASEHLHGTLAEVQRAIDLDFWDDFAESLGFLYCYSEQVTLSGLSCSGQVAKQRWTINLLPFITVQGPGEVTFTLNDQGQPVGGVRKTFPKGWLVGGVDVCDDGFLLDARAWVDWSRVPIPDLPGPPLQRGKSVWLAAEDFDLAALISREVDPRELDLRVLSYGFADHEAGAVDEEFENHAAELLAFDPAWLTAGDRRGLRIAESIRDSRDFSCLGVVADALEEAGCDNPLLLWHCRLPPAAHARGSWVVEFLLAQVE